ncbi:MAG: TonB-dependent receptor plug domain-containing protein [Planctomycetaceae bacterium]
MKNHAPLISVATVLILLAATGNAQTRSETFTTPADAATGMELDNSLSIAPEGDNEPRGHTEVDEDDILDMDLHELTNVNVVIPSFDVEVVSVTRRESTVGKSASAVFVISNEMIRRSGATNLAEALRLAPGLTVSRIDTNRWAISSRGFSGEFANKLLVMIDGRSVYTPVYSGVHWSFQDTPLEDVERIEVIRGPGASVWGANAVNGVINIITKDAAQTQGGFVSTGGGTETQSANHFRYGEQLENGLSYRVYGTHLERDAGQLSSMSPQDDGRISRLGIRADWPLESVDRQQLTFIGELYQGNSGGNLGLFPSTFPFGSVPAARDEPFNGGFAMLTWSQTDDDGSARRVQAYFDHQTIDSLFSTLQLQTYNLDFQRTLPVTERHTITYGLTCRLNADRFQPNTPLSTFTPAARNTHLVGTYLQDEISVVPDRLSLIAGARLDYNSYSQFEFQPSLRLISLIDDRNAVWAGVSRAVRTPSRAEHSLQLTLLSPVLPLPLMLSGNPKIQAEDVLAFECGYRTQVSEFLAWDASLFLNEYSNVTVFDTFHGPTGFPPHLTTTFLNDGSVKVYGLELNATCQLTDSWRLAAWYSLARPEIRGVPPFSPTPNALGFAEHQARLTSSWNLTERTDLDVMLRYVDTIEAFRTPGYVECDVRLAWRLFENCEISLMGRNLLQGSHYEYASAESYFLPTLSQREVYGQLTWRF